MRKSANTPTYLGSPLAKTLAFDPTYARIIFVS